MNEYEAMNLTEYSSLSDYESDTILTKNARKTHSDGKITNK